MDYEIHPKTGKALDLSGAFAFAVFLILFTVFGLTAFAFASALAMVAFVLSFMAWVNLEAGNDGMHARFRGVTAVFAAASAAAFLFAVVAWFVS